MSEKNAIIRTIKPTKGHDSTQHNETKTKGNIKMTNKDVRNCKDFMAMPHNLVLWIKNNYTYVVVAGDNPPTDGRWIQCLSGGDSYRFGRFFIDTERKMWRFPTEKENVEFLDDILNWVLEYHFHEDRKYGIGYVSAEIQYEDSSEKTWAVYTDIPHEAEKYLACSLIEKVAMPCEDYAADFDDTDSNFGFRFVYHDGGRLHFSATFRV